ncbi:Maf family protein [Vermiculatibacterium agrestimuris]|uniref:Maf family protein n=1 Tax=Vermiculatibacterium agrestimuris TaxID=2941519 RepID=UPI00203C38CA|nr:Maf family protein [Vermiculatibacterium agrestimuris]
MDIVLASQSPRRQELLKQMGLTYRVHAVDIDEHMERSLAPGQLVEAISREKAAACAALEGPEPLIIAADTVVAWNDQVLGKPADPADACRMLRALSGQTHTVFTGFTVRRGEGAVTRSERTEVTFRALTEAEISAYVRTGEPMDKAGAYGIQGLGSLLVEGIRGDYFNVMGLPICALGLHLREFGVNCLTGTEK